ncbi:MAG: lipid-A-disaccharide synthase [Candidatus Omnitrophota bacterium]|nr:lipid-A-disaccharide synthase [Candidatus Omnitrophota bacterium]
MAQINHIFIICGEPSGDLNAANLAKAILQINPKIKISGVGGTLLRQAPAVIYQDIKDLAVIGLFDVLKKLPKFFSLQKLILEKIKEEKPDAIILVDFSGFNLRLAKKINPSTTLRIDGEPSRTINKALPVIYYVSPQVWASRPGRIETIKGYIHKMIVLFKFEEEFYKKRGVGVDFVGHPLLDIVKPVMDKKEFLNKFNLSDSKTTIALLPGSRKQEIENILPIMLKTSLLINQKIKNAQFLIVKPPQVGLDIYKRIISGVNIDLKIIEGKTYDCLNIADFCLVASGTATLETAIMQRPFVIIYKMNLLNYFLYRPQVKVPYIGMVNIVAGRKIVPEFIQFGASPNKISEQVLEILQNPARIEQIKNSLAQVKSSLGEKGAGLRAAQIILNFLNSEGTSL